MSLRVILNFALTADGKISTREKSPARFTSLKDLEKLHEIRKMADAILVGRGTLEADQMTLTTKSDKQPLRAVLSRTGIFDKSHPIFQKEGGPLHLIITEGPGDPPRGPTIHQCSLSEWLEWLAEQPDTETLLCEGGGQLAHALFQLDCVDEIFLTLATHSLFGGKSALTLTGETTSFLPKSLFYRLESISDAAPGEYFLHYTRKDNLS